ncbi:flagellar biosynthesis protein FliQ [Acidaminobacter sp.]|uniref:flagellar biosynthesis protein FliQ n=1 Tax=Acidaminobacter sp. TaxID=1872102 RepID=UPI00137FAD44|nr:flagellar biosynthesis protein FliQ [Acidaminobacter sp.]MDK9710572.1 flagellar biosynthesis protein FliQ [Acidaminobacter sp.]MZQ96817.1 flagellar biosynthesis protein FliQ [Acidaminobacter sp.]
MSESVVLDVFNEALMTMLKVSLPVLLIALVVGLIISVLQATTQIQEQTLSFVPKMIAVFVGLIIFGSYMLNLLLSFTQKVILMIAEIQ